MTCKFCGKELSEGAAFCPECGKNVEETVVEEIKAPKKKFNLDYNTVRLILGTVIVFIGIIRLMSSSVSISSTSFGGDFYTYTYKGIVACAKMLGTINATISWALIAFGAYIDVKALKEKVDNK